MVRKRKSKLLEKSINAIFMVVGVIVAFGVGGLFLNGTFLDVILLKLLPLIVHQGVGWIIIVSTGIGAVAQLFKAFR